jgi:HEAT repeat protein
MPIKASSSRTIDTLVGDLSSTSDVVRETAIARLTVIGGRAVERLLTLSQSNAAAFARLGALRALEAIGDPRALAPSLRTVGDPDPAVATAAIAVARRFLKGASGAQAVDRLTAAALDRRRPEEVRVAALRALRTLEPSTLEPLLKTLAGDPVVDSSARPAASPIAADVPLSELLASVETARDRAAALPENRRGKWTAARAAAHLALARRGSRIALYDLREWLDGAGEALPADALAAVSVIGDASCLEPIAKAHTRSRDERWRRGLLEAFAAIMKRERLTRRHAVIKKLVAKGWTGMAGVAGGAGGAGGAGRGKAG